MLGNYIKAFLKKMEKYQKNNHPHPRESLRVVLPYKTTHTFLKISLSVITKQKPNNQACLYSNPPS